MPNRMRFGSTESISDHQRALRGQTIEAFLPQRGRVLEVGPGGAKYSRKGCEVVTVDSLERTEVTARGDVQALPFRDDSFDALIATEVIEHVRYPYKMMREMWRVTRPTGRLLLSTPNVATFTNRVALMFFALFPDDRTLHEGADVGHLHYFTRPFFLDALRSNRFEVLREWTQLMPITPKRYLYDSVLERTFRNFVKQVIVECRPRKSEADVGGAHR